MKEIAKGVCDAVETFGLDCNWRATEAVLVALAGIALMLLLSWLATRIRFFRRLLDGIYWFSGVLAAIFMIAMLGIIVGQMVARWSSIAFPGSTSYAGYCMAASSFLGLAYTLNQSAHIRVSLMLTALGRHRKWGEVWCFAIGALLATYFARYAIKATILSEKINDISQGQDATPLWIPQIAMCVGGVLVAAALWDNLFTILFTGQTNLREETVEGETTAPMEAQLEELSLTIIFVFVLFLLLGTGVWVALALLGVAVVGMELFTTRPAGDAMITTIWSASSSWTLTALPLFIWMGEILFRTRLSEDMFRGLAPWMARLPGGLLHTNIVGCTIFAAVSGSSAATLTTVGKMSIPELRRRNYPEFMTVGTLAGAATLGLMIPPSLTLIVYGVTINESISKLFMAGVVPGLVLALMFMSYVVAWHYLFPGQRPNEEPRTTFREKLSTSRYLIPVILLITLVIGSMYLGFATATEAAAFGVLGALALALVQGSLNVETFGASMMGAVRTSTMVAFILMGAAFLSLAMGFTGLPRALAEFIAEKNFSPYALIAALTIFYIIIGMFLDGISSVVLTMAVVEPMVNVPAFQALGFDMVWFGIFVVVVVEMAQITPPIGFNLFVMQGLTKHEIGYIARTAFPMFLIMVLMVAVLVYLPDLATWLPESMRTTR